MANKTWVELVAPTVARCEVAAKFGMNAVWNADGADALGKLIRTMAEKLDDAVRRELVDGETG